MEMGKDKNSSYSLSLPQDTLTHWTKCYVLASYNVENILWTRKINLLLLLPRINLPGYNTDKRGEMSKDILTSRCFVRGEIESKEGDIKFLRTIQWGCDFSCTKVFQKHQYPTYLSVYFRETLSLCSSLEVDHWCLGIAIELYSLIWTSFYWKT